MTSVLLDTRVALWWLAADPWLTDGMQQAVHDADEAHVCAASTWEVAIKMAIGKLTVQLEAGETFAGACRQQGFTLDSTTHDDAWSIRSLPPSRTDPFDRLIAATAKRRGWTVVTADEAFEVFGVPLVGPFTQ